MPISLPGLSRRLLWTLAFVGAHVALSLVAFRVRAVGGDAIFWGLSGLSAAVLAQPPTLWRRWLAGGLVLACAISYLIVGASLPMALGFAAANTGQALVAAHVFRRRLPQGRRIVLARHIGWLVVAALGGATAGAAMGGLTFLLATGTIDLGTVGAWFAGNTVGVLVGSPLVLALVSVAKEPPPTQKWAPTLMSGGAIGLVFAIAIWGSGATGRNVSYIVILPLMISAVWVGQRHTAILVGALALAAGAVTIAGAGPFAATISGLHPLLAAQLFMSVVQLTVLTVAVEASRRRDVIAELDAILEATVEGVLVVDETGVIRRANAGGEAILGSPAGGLIGRRLAPLVPVETSDDVATLFLTRARRVDDAPFWAEVSRGEIQELSGRLRSAVVIRDVTGRIETEQRVKQMQDEFVSNMTHELKTPLTAIIGFSDWLLSEPDSPTLNDDLETIRDSAFSMKLLIDDILDFKRVAGAPGERAPVDLAAIVERSMELIRTVAADRSVDIKMTLDDRCLPIAGDADQLDHAVRNLLSNAVKYSKPGGVVTVALQSGEDSVVLSVADQGIGIPQADQVRLFERFFRAGNVGDIQGTGLGLALVRQVVTRHEGTLELSSAVDEGTRVRVTLPARHTALPEPQNSIPLHPVAAGSQGP